MQRAAAVASGKALSQAYPPTPEILARAEAGRRRAAAEGRNSRNWVPPEGYAALNAELRRKQIKQADRKAIIAAQIVTDERRRLAAMTPFERQMDQVSRGAALVLRPVKANREYGTLGGVSAGLL